MGAALLTMRLAPTSSVADLVHRRAEANNELPIRELMWGMPGSMVAEIHMAEMTQEPRWRELFEVQAARLLADLEDTPQGLLWTLRSLWSARPLSRACPRLCRQCHPIVARVGLVDAGAASPSGRVCAENPGSQSVAVRVWSNVGPEKQARAVASDLSALSWCAWHRDDLCGCAFFHPRI